MHCTDFSCFYLRVRLSGSSRTGGTPCGSPSQLFKIYCKTHPIVSSGIWTETILCVSNLGKLYCPGGPLYCSGWPFFVLAYHFIVPANHNVILTYHLIQINCSNWKLIVPADHFIVPADHFIVPTDHFIVCHSTWLD